MALDLLLGIDIGTQGVKSTLFDQNGSCLGTAFIPSRLHQPEPGITEEDPEFQLDSVCRSISECLKEISEADRACVRALAIDGQMAGIVGVGEDGMNVTPYDSWLDTRCAPYIKVMREKAEGEIIRKTGNPPSFNHGPKVLWWKHEHPQVYDKIVSFVQPAGYAAMRLCGLKGAEGFIDKTYLHFSGYADNKNACWDKGLCESFDVDMAKLPRIVSPTDIVGTLTDEMAGRCGLPSGVKVAAGCGDTAASFLSCGAVEPGICVDVAGTASVFAATTDDFCYDEETRVMGCGASVTDGLWHPYAYINGGGMNIEWFLSEVLGRDREDGARFKGMEDSELKPREDDPLFIPHMAGRGMPSQPEMKGTFAGLSWNHTKKDMFAAVMEAVALEYGIYRQSLKSMLPEAELTEMRITGGGDNSPVWKQMKSGVLQVPVVSITQKHGAPMGAAIVAGVACGVLSSTRDAAEKWISTRDSTVCDPGLYDYYRKRTARYEALLESMNDYYTREF